MGATFPAALLSGGGVGDDVIGLVVGWTGCWGGGSVCGTWCG